MNVKSDGEESRVGLVRSRLFHIYEYAMYYEMTTKQIRDKWVEIRDGYSSGDIVAQSTSIRVRQGLLLIVRSNGTAYWLLRYTHLGQRVCRSLGSYPEMPYEGCVYMSQGHDGHRFRQPGARDYTEDVFRALQGGIDPKTVLEPSRDERHMSVAEAAMAWFQSRSEQWSDSHATNVLQRIQKDIIPVLGSRPVDSIKEKDALAVYDRAKNRGAENLAGRVLEYLHRIIRYNGATPFSIEMLREQERVVVASHKRHHPACTTEVGFSRLLRSINDGTNRETLRIGLRLLALFFCRPGALQRAEWSEFDARRRMWIIPGDRIGNKRKRSECMEPHEVPLSNQALHLLNRLNRITGSSRHLFPAPESRDRCISDRAFGSMLDSLGYKNRHTPHGFRASARTLLDEVLEFQERQIHAQLGHVTRSPNGRAYDRATHMRKRREMMQCWADYLDELVAGKYRMDELSI